MIQAELRYAAWRDLPAPDPQYLGQVFDATLTRRADEQRLPEDRRRFLLAHLMLHQQVATFLGLPPAQVRLACPANEKPRLVSPEVAIDLSLTHAGNWIGSALATAGARIGLDIEAEQPSAHIDLVQRDFSQREIDLLARLQTSRRQRAFLSYWTGKEAVAKALGVGLGLPLDAIILDLSPADLAPIGISLPPAIDIQPGSWHLTQQPLPDGAVLTAACHAATTAPPRWQIARIEHL